MKTSTRISRASSCKCYSVLPKQFYDKGYIERYMKLEKKGDVVKLPLVASFLDHLRGIKQQRLLKEGEKNLLKNCFSVESI